MVIAFYISGHGFGHASRSIELIHALLRRQPDLRVVVKTSAPKWLFEVAQLPALEYRTLETGVGMSQADSITIDLEDTARRAREFYRDFAKRADTEAASLREDGVALVLSDIPPLAHAAAARAGVASIGISNFTWDWIYEGYETFHRDAPGVVPAIREAYALAERALRLPMHGGFATFDTVEDIPFVARRSTRDPEETRRLLNIPDGRPFVLASFGGYGVDMPFDAIGERQHLTVRTIGAELPAPLMYPDVVAAADVVLSKPGYGIISECAANGTPLLYTSRGPFREYDVFVAQMPRVLRCRFMPQDDLRAGRWGAHVEALLAQAQPPERARIDGAEIAAGIILGRT